MSQHNPDSANYIKIIKELQSELDCCIAILEEMLNSSGYLDDFIHRRNVEEIVYSKEVQKVQEHS